VYSRDILRTGGQEHCPNRGAMNRINVIQGIIDAKQAKSYLEIGFGNGDCFYSIKAPLKMTVDPRFFNARKQKIKYYIKHWRRICAEYLRGVNKYFEMTSDDFFRTRSGVLKKFPPDVVFVDGLHSHEQSLKDVLNVLEYLNKGGVVVLHDCCPRSEAQAYPARSYKDVARLRLPGWNGQWSGDVWKTVVYLRSRRPDLNVFVLDTDMGLGIVTAAGTGGPPALGYSLEEIKQLSYTELEKRRDVMLNLKGREHLSEFLRTV